MSGETEKDAFGWTLDTLYRHISQKIADADRRYEQRFAAMQDAIVKAERATELRFDSVNEFRAALNDRAGTYQTLAASDTFEKSVADRFEQISARLDQITTRINMREGELAGVRHTNNLARDNFGLLLAIMSSIGAFIAFVVSSLLYYFKG